MDPRTIQPYIDLKLVNEQVHPSFDWLHIYNYTHKCQIESVWGDITTKCRGLIIDTRDNSIVANPFPKFFNLEEFEGKGHELPNETPQIHEKIDGSLGILYWVDDAPFIATRGSFTSNQSVYATWYFNKHADFSQYDRSRTYLFEIIYPENRIVVKYDWAGLVLLAVRDTKTGKDYDITSNPGLKGIRNVEPYDGKEVSELKSLEKDNAEGFVVLYPKAGLRLKVKFDEYVRLHRIVTNVTPRSIWDAMRNGSDLSDILERVPDEFYNWVHDLKIKFERDYWDIILQATKAYENVDIFPTRKEQAIHIMKHYKQFSGVVFAMLDDKDYSQLIWKLIKPKADDAFKKEV